jgi:hypothetical protein
MIALSETGWARTARYRVTGRALSMHASFLTFRDGQAGALVIVGGTAGPPPAVGVLDFLQPRQNLFEGAHFRTPFRSSIQRSKSCRS